MRESLPQNLQSLWPLGNVQHNYLEMRLCGEILTLIDIYCLLLNGVKLALSVYAQLTIMKTMLKAQPSK